MRKFSPEFSDHIKSEATTLCWCWRLERADGQVLGFTDHDLNLNFDGVEYKAASGFSSGQIKAQIGFDIDTSTVFGLLKNEQIKSEDIEAGLYDGASIKLFRVNWQNLQQNALIWSGRFGRIRLGGSAFEAEVLGRAADLQQATGRVFARTCDASFADSRCGLNAADFPQNTDCPRTIKACRGFNNVINFRGFPYLIGDDAAYAALGKTDPKDGGSRY